MAAEAPALSIVVVSFNAAAMLERCLESLNAQAAQHRAEILVVRAAGDFPSAALAARFAIRWVNGRALETVPRLRQLGIRAAAADIVALLEDDCVADAQWCAAVLEAHRGPWVAVGGAVEPGPYAHARDWAVYFYEYGRFMLPFLPHDSSLLPGNNVSYKRRALEPFADGGEGFLDVFVHQQLAAQGAPMRLTPTLVVRNANSWPRAHLVVAPFHHGRAFAARRVSGRSAAVRAAMGALAVFLPVLQATRLVRLTAGRGHRLAELVRAGPWLFVFAASWAAGEFAGYVLGPGRSLQRWR